MKNGKSVEIRMSGREWSRQFYTAVVRKFDKTVTEPITNSDSSYKRKFNLPDATGLVEKALSFQKGTLFDLSTFKAELAKKSPIREIEIHLYAAQGHANKPRTCEIVDHAEGLDSAELVEAFKSFAADKAHVSKGKPGRSLFGRGVSDVLLGHLDGEFYSFKNGFLTKAEFSFDPTTKDDTPHFKIIQIGKASATTLKELHLRPGENGSCVRFVLHPDCRLPEEGTIVPLLSQTYMLRLINADPNTRVKIIRYRGGSKVFEDFLDYDFPIGDVIDSFSFNIPKPVPGENLSPLKVEGIVCRAKGGLPRKDSREQRANGFLVVDDKDAVLDLTLLPEFENAPHLANIFGIIRITNVREVFDYYLNIGKDSPLTTTRDGFDSRHDFTKKLWKELLKRLDPIYKGELERFNRSLSENLSKKTRQRLNEAIKELNKFLKDLLDETNGKGGFAGEPIRLNTSKALQFVPQLTRLIVGKPRTVRLYFKKDLAKGKGGSVIFDTDNDKIEVKPLSYQVGMGRENEEFYIYDLSLKCDVIGESGKITALAEGTKETYEASLNVMNVETGNILIPPDEMEFRPNETHGRPSIHNNLTLFINPKTIPIGRKIVLELAKVHGGIGFMEDGKRVSSVNVKFLDSHLQQGSNVGKILIPWTGTGWGQSARVIAKTKKPDGKISYAEGRIVLEEPEESHGIIKDVKYMNLGNEKCSDLVDGVIYINSAHFLNKYVFGTEQEYTERIDNNHTAQYRLSSLVVEQAVFRLAEDNYRENELVLSDLAPITDLREFIDQKTHQFAPKIVKKLMTG